MSTNDTYLIHAAGIQTMMVWIDEQNRLGMPCQITEQFIIAHPLINRYFSIAVGGKKKQPFIAIQPNESSWIKLISWNKIIIKENENKIYFVSNFIAGDGMEFPDIPAFSFVLEFDDSKKINLIKNQTKIESREYYLDDDNQLHFNYHQTLFSLEIKLINEDALVIDQSNDFGGDQILLKQEKTLEEKYPNGAPDFLGTAADLSDPEFKKVYNQVHHNLTAPPEKMVHVYYEDEKPSFLDKFFGKTKKN